MNATMRYISPGELLFSLTNCCSASCNRALSTLLLLLLLLIIIIIIIINTLQYSKRIEGQPTTCVGSPKKLKLNLLNYKTKVPRNC